jgi:hypothetical protein
MLGPISPGARGDRQQHVDLERAADRDVDVPDDLTQWRLPTIGIEPR